MCADGSVGGGVNVCDCGCLWLCVWVCGPARTLSEPFKLPALSNRTQHSIVRITKGDDYSSAQWPPQPPTPPPPPPTAAFTTQCCCYSNRGGVFMGQYPSSTSLTTCSCVLPCALTHQPPPPTPTPPPPIAIPQSKYNRF